MDQTVKVKNSDWAKAEAYAKNENGNSPTQSYNNFISSNGGVAVPTETDGGPIPDKEMFQKFMEFKAKNEAKEVAAFSVKGGDNHIVQPWIINKPDWSENNKSFVTGFAYSTDDINGQYHSHPGYSGASSWQDAKFSTRQGFPSY